MGKKGYTLVEILFVLAIIGILSSIATMSMAEYVADAKLRTTIFSLGSHVRHAGMMALGGPSASTIKFDIAARSYTLNGMNDVLLPSGVRFGAHPEVTAGPGDSPTALPEDGISFDSPGHDNTIMYYPEGYVVPAGTIYITDGKRTMALRVTSTGRIRQWKASGGANWIEI